MNHVAKIALPTILMLAVFPLFAPNTFLLYLFTQIFIFGIFTIGYDLLLGYTGMLSFGHAGLFGLGAYVSAFMLKSFSYSLLPSLAAAMAVTMVASLFIGYICIRVSGIYFAMLTLVFGQLIYEAANHFVNLTGGADGIVGVPRSTFLLVDMAKEIPFYYLTLILLIMAYGFARLLVSSPCGQVLQAIRGNEQRSALVGFRTQAFKFLAFAISGTYAGLAGGLISPFLSNVGPTLAHWGISGDVMIMTLVGGKGTLLGPILGSAFLFIVKDLIGSYTHYWMIILGTIFVIFVIVAPSGLMGVLQALGRKLNTIRRLSRTNE